jgi:hypothetical protein
MQTESREGTAGIIPPSRRRPPLVGSHYFVSALVLVVGAIPPPPSIIAAMVIAVVAVLVVVCRQRLGAAVEGGGGGQRQRRRQWRRQGGSNGEMVCGVCSRVYGTLLGEASKIWEVGRKSAGSRQEVGRNFFVNRYRIRSIDPPPNPNTLGKLRLSAFQRLWVRGSRTESS